ncbi:MAG: hypothetical protein ACI33J_09945 [Clostridium sp.]
MNFFILVLSIFFFFTVPAKGVEIKDIKEDLEEIGLEEEYRENIETYLENLNISKEDINNITEEAKEVMGSIQDKNSISDFSFSEIWGLYKKTKDVAKDLNLDFGFSIANKSFTLKDKKNNNVLIEGSISDLENYYDKYVAILKDKTSENNKSKESNLETNILKQDNNEKEIITKIEDENETPSKALEENKNSYNNISEKKVDVNKNNVLENKDKNISIASKKTISSKIPLIIAGIFTIGALGVLKVLKKV